MDSNYLGLFTIIKRDENRCYGLFTTEDEAREKFDKSVPKSKKEKYVIIKVGDVNEIYDELHKKFIDEN